LYTINQEKSHPVMG